MKALEELVSKSRIHSSGHCKVICLATHNKINLKHSYDHIYVQGVTSLDSF
jgi:hypothetical protein